MEPNKIESWEWYDLHNLPDGQFGGLKNYFKALKNESNYFDA